MSLQAYSPQTEFEHCLAREKQERAAAAAATDPSVVSAHMAMAECYADRVRTMSEEHDLPYPPSGLWPSQQKRRQRESGDRSRSAMSWATCADVIELPRIALFAKGESPTHSRAAHYCRRAYRRYQKRTAFIIIGPSPVSQFNDLPPASVRDWWGGQADTGERSSGDCEA